MDIASYLKIVTPHQTGPRLEQDGPRIIATFLHEGPTISYRTAALTFSMGTKPHPLAEKLVGATWAPSTGRTPDRVRETLGLQKASLTAQSVLADLVDQGWLAIWQPYERRGTAPGEVSYRLGPATLQARTEQESNAREAREAEISYLQRTIGALPNPHQHPGFEVVRSYVISEPWEPGDLHFFSALLQVASRLHRFDWKEIGAHYPRTGVKAPSKQFDAGRERLLDVLDGVLGDDLSSIGLTTLPGTQVVLFNGDLTLHIPGHPARPYLHSSWPESLTGGALAVAERLEHDAHTVLAVENLGVLRRLVQQYDAHDRPQVIFCGFEGQVRSAHYRFLRLLAEGGARRLIIWSDCDRAALAMLDKLSTLPYPDHRVIVPPGRCVGFAEGREHIAAFVAAGGGLYEQERDIGTPDLWELWLRGLPNG